MGMIRCKKCGLMNSDMAKKCLRCGWPVNTGNQRSERSRQKMLEKLETDMGATLNRRGLIYLELAKKEHNDSMYAKAFESFQEAAQNGSVEGQYNLGLCWQKGQGIGADPKKAFRCFLRAARKGHTAAMAELAGCYMRGEGVLPDEKAALTWLQRSEEQGNAPAKAQPEH